MNRTQLAEKLANLRAAATQTHQLNEGARVSLYRTLAATYLLWRDFSQDPEYLEEQYRASHIDYVYRDSNEIQFRPFLRLTFQYETVDGYINNKLTQWQHVLRRLDAHYCENQSQMASNPVGHLIAFIEDCGGLTNMAANGGKGVSETEVAERVKPSLARAIVERQISADAIAKRRMEMLKDSKHLPCFASVAADASVRANADGFVAVFAKRAADGSLMLIGSTADSAAINMVAAHALKNTSSLVSKSLRVLGEVIGIQRFPEIGKPNGKTQQRDMRDKVLYDQIGTVKVEGSSKKQARLSARRLLVRGNTGEVILSSMRVERAVTIICEPAIKLVGKQHNVYLKTNERGFIENAQALGEFDLLRAEPHDKLAAVDGELFTHTLAVRNVATDKSNTLHLYALGREQDDATNNWQGGFNKRLYKPTWKAVVGSDWFQQLRTSWLDEWQSTLGRNKQLKRENNRAFGIRVNAKSLTVRFNDDGSGKAPSRSFPVSPSFVAGDTRYACSVRAKDIAPVLYNIADMSATGDIELSGNNDAVVLTFATAMGRFTVAVPTIRSTEDGNIATQLFHKEG